jgi:mono/diheme cytochrome c family protein
MPGDRHQFGDSDGFQYRDRPARPRRRPACSQCHGTVGQSSRPTGPHIAPDPMPFEAFADLLRRPRNIMPPYTTVVLSDQQLTDIYAYLLTIPPLIDPKAAAILDLVG